MSKWISVDERLPKDDSVVLVLDNNEYIIGWYKDGSFGEWNGVYELRQVTHWMPLPDPPKY